MGTVIKKPSGVYEAQVAKKGIRKSKTFRTKAQANMWIVETEKDIIAGKKEEIPDKTFGDLLSKYSEEVSPKKRGARWEMARLNALQRDEIAQVMLTHLEASHFALWRDRRLLNVSAGSVLREINILSHAINTAIKDWGWLKINPLSNIRRPAQPQPRDRLISDDEVDRLLIALGYDYDMPPVTISARIGAALLFAIETAMRAGEIAGLTWDRVDISKRTARLIETKNGTKRDVPLSMEAIRIIKQLSDVPETDCGNIFQLNSSQIDVNFRKAKSRAMITDLHFHDSRAEAITRLAKKVDILTLARISGHKDLRMLQIYYRESAEDIARKL